VKKEKVNGNAKLAIKKVTLRDLDEPTLAAVMGGGVPRPDGATQQQIGESRTCCLKFN
jgi:hypothetical protein